jgi:hypothetical protein
MREFGWVVLGIAALFGFYALSMDVSVDTGGMFGRVNNIGLMNDQRNYLMIAGIGLIGGLIVVVFGSSAIFPTSIHSPSSKMTDPFDEIDAEAENELKRYAISLGVKREDGKYWYEGSDYADLEGAIQAAESVSRISDPAQHFLG